MTASSSLLAVTDLPRDVDVIDADHLARMTLGDRQLEREVLEIFVRQSNIMIGRIAKAEPALAAAAAHTLTGSARGIGAWRVARAAERLEHAASQASKHDIDAAFHELQDAAVEAGAAIGARLGDHLAERSIRY